MKKSLVVGLGKSGLAAAKLLNDKNIPFYTFESNYSENHRKLLDPLKSHIQSFKADNELEEFLSDISEAIISPGISPTSKLVKLLKSNKIEIKTEIDLALDYLSGKYIAITGTNGKSTLTQVVANILQDDGFIAAGNIGYPACEAVLQDRESNLSLELSSYQIEYMDMKKAPYAAVFLSFATDHLERHGSLEEYFRVKWSLIEATLNNSGHALISEDILQYAIKYELKHDFAKLTIISDKDQYQNTAYLDQNTLFIESSNVLKKLSIPHGLSIQGDSLVAAFFLFSLTRDIEDPVLIKQLRDFKGLPYRYEKVAERNGFSIINDSKSTNVHSTIFALNNTDDPIILFLGGVGKKESYHGIIKYSDKIKKLVCFGKDGKKIAKELRSLGPIEYPSLAEALLNMEELLKYPSANILFSPACASFDEFKNFEDRGKFFNDHIK